MKVTQEKLPQSQIGLEIEISPEMSKKAYEQVFQDLARSANIPGFRKGKVPRHILVQRFGSTRLKAAALEELIRDGVKEAIKQESIEAIGNYQLRSDFDRLVNQFEPGKALTFSATVDVPPVVNLKEYTGLQLKAEEVKYDPSSVDKFLEERRKEHATLVPVSGRPAQWGDTAVVDFKGRLTGAGEGEGEAGGEIPGGEAQDFQVELAEGRFIKGFVDGIVGLNVGETKEISVQFPADYPQKDLADKPAMFEVTLKDLKEKELPELNDDFADEVSEFQTLEELRSHLESRFQEQAESKTKANKQEVLLNELLKQVEVDLPQTLIEEEINELVTQTAMRLSNQGIDIKRLFTQEMIPQLRERSRPEAIDRIKRTLALREIGKRESIEVESAAVKARMQELLEEYGDGKDIDPQRLQEFVENELLTEKIVAWLEEHSTIELVPEGSLSPATEEKQLETEANADVEVAAEVETSTTDASTPAAAEILPTQGEQLEA
ncbi:trigger factor [Planktothrix sp. FACHB-1355]|uniref:Trigger factor n=1 Tax=Aerosakkonema funiforme FACHB-1375 TaxID=2949571 RepID=A0A926VD14_9CYAN|nr:MULTISPECIES: trigger factor [Oscillatoriales]MBD2181562.1 trigger factor [Aerosakkonema funiforme FACHB-1375]MBD3560319.1 trigger factor [Planktothrix sp. FACHB-1355]